MDSELASYGLADELDRSRRYFGVSDEVEAERETSLADTVVEDICIEDFLKDGLSEYFGKLSNDKVLPISVVGQDVVLTALCAYHADDDKVLVRRFEAADVKYRVLHDLEDSVPVIKGGIRASVEASDKITCVSINARNDEELMTMLSRRNTGMHSQSFGFENINMFTFKRKITGEQNTDCFFLKLWLTYIECVIAESMGDRDGVVMESDWSMGYTSPQNWMEVCDVYKNYDIVFDGKTIGNDLCAVVAIGIGPYPKYAHHYNQGDKVVAPLPALYEIEADRGIILGIEDIIMEDDFIANPEVLRRHIVTLSHFLNAGESSAAAMRMALVLSSSPRFIESGKAIVSNLSSSVCYRGSLGPDLWPRTIIQPPSDIYKDTNKANIVTALALTHYRLEGVMEEIGGYTGWRTNGNRVTYEGLACVFNTVGLMELEGREAMGDAISKEMFGGADPLGALGCYIKTYCLATMKVGRRAVNVREPALCKDLPLAFDGGWSEKFWKTINIDRDMFELTDSEMNNLFNDGDERYSVICEKRNIFNSWRTPLEVYGSTELALANGHTDIFRVPEGIAALYNTPLHLTLEYVRVSQRRDPTRVMRSLYSNESLPIERSNYAIMADMKPVVRERVENIPMPTEDLVFTQNALRLRNDPAHEGASGIYPGTASNVCSETDYLSRYGSHEIGAGFNTGISYTNTVPVINRSPKHGSRARALSETAGGNRPPLDRITTSREEEAPQVQNSQARAYSECSGYNRLLSAAHELGGGDVVLESTSVRSSVPLVVPLGSRAMNSTEAALTEFSQKYVHEADFTLVPQAAGVYRKVADGTTEDVQYAYALALNNMPMSVIDLMYIMVLNDDVEGAREMTHNWIAGRHPSRRGTDILAGNRTLIAMQTDAIGKLEHKGVLKEHASYAIHNYNASNSTRKHRDEL